METPYGAGNFAPELSVPGLVAKDSHLRYI